MKLVNIVCDCCKNITMKSWLKCIIVYFFSPYYCEEKINISYRLAVFMRKKNKKIFMRIIEYKILKKFNCYISSDSEILKGLRIPHPIGIVIGKGVCAGKNLILYQNVTIGQNNGEYPVIGDNVIIYAGAKIIGNIVIGNNVVIGTNSVVTKSIPDNAVVVGNPAKIIKYRSEDDEFY